MTIYSTLFWCYHNSGLNLNILLYVGEDRTLVKISNPMAGVAGWWSKIRMQDTQITVYTHTGRVQQSRATVWQVIHSEPLLLYCRPTVLAPPPPHAADRSQSRPTDLVSPHPNPSPDLEGPWTCCSSTDCSLRSIPHFGAVGIKNTPDGRKMSRLDWTAFNTSSFTALTVSNFPLLTAIALMVFLNCLYNIDVVYKLQLFLEKKKLKKILYVQSYVVTSS